jgi:hypothetical protein
MLPILTFHFEFLVIVVDQFAVHAFDELVVLVGGIFGHSEKLSGIEARPLTRRKPAGGQGGLGGTDLT